MTDRTSEDLRSWLRKCHKEEQIFSPLLRLSRKALTEWRSYRTFRLSDVSRSFHTIAMDQDAYDGTHPCPTLTTHCRRGSYYRLWNLFSLPLALCSPPHMILRTTIITPHFEGSNNRRNTWQHAKSTQHGGFHDAAGQRFFPLAPYIVPLYQPYIRHKSQIRCN